MGSFGVGRKIKERRQGKHNKCAKNFGTPKNMLSAQITPKRRRGRDGGKGLEHKWSLNGIDSCQGHADKCCTRLPTGSKVLPPRSGFPFAFHVLAPSDFHLILLGTWLPTRAPFYIHTFISRSACVVAKWFLILSRFI